MYWIPFIVPLILLTLYALYPTEFLIISYTFLGKLVAFLCIVLYSFVHPIYGLFVCLCVTYFYQLEIDSFLHEGFETKVSFLPTSARKQGSAFFIDYEEGNYTSVKSAYPTLSSVPKESEAIFRKKHCRGNNLFYKDLQVRRLENTEHVYPELEFEGENCNACDLSCRFAIKNQATELQLQPKKSKEFVMEPSENGKPFIGTTKDRATFL